MPSCREEQAALGKELETTKAELLDLQLKRDKISWCSTDITESKMRLQELADCLRAALQEEVGPLPWGRGQEGGRGGGGSDTRGSSWCGFETPSGSPGQYKAVASCALAPCSLSPLKDDDAPLRSRAWTPAPRTPGWQTPRRAWTPACRTPACRTPYHARPSFVGSVLKAVSGKGELTPAIWVLGVPGWGWRSLPPMLGMCAGAVCGGDPSAFRCGFPGCSFVASMDWGFTTAASVRGLLWAPRGGWVYE